MPQWPLPTSVNLKIVVTLLLNPGREPMKLRLPSYILVLLLCLLVVNCAKRGTPTGGPEDDTPPKLTSAEPEVYATNFNTDRIRIYFDEFIKLKDLQKQLIVSPPLDASAYSITPQGAASRYIDIRIKDTLAQNTTYTFNFGQSIVDNNEDNPYEYFQYVFSTGSYIDSLAVRGIIKDAVNRNPDQFVSVMLYEIDSAYTDSVIYKQKPTYITNTLDSIVTFNISNLRAGKYLMVALKDEANNYVFDQNTDKIGFVDNVITVPSDTLYELTLFNEEVNFSFGRPAHVAKNRITFGYTGDPKDMKVELLSPKPAEFQSVLLKDTAKDSLDYWFTPFEADSLQFRVQKGAETKDFTVKLRKLAPDSLEVGLNQKRTLSLQKRLAITSNTPLVKADSTFISIVDKDSTNVTFKTIFEPQENLVYLDFEPSYSQRYRVNILPNAVQDLFGMVNDTLSFNLATKSPSDLGNLSLTLKNVQFYPIIIQLTNEKGEVIREAYATKPQQEYYFEGLDPGRYNIRVIDDTNKNGIWDTGNFLLRKQPERIRYKPGTLELRANWEYNDEFTLAD